MKYDIDHEFVSITSQTATHRIILLHGWGADSDDLLRFGKDIREKIYLDFEVISLRAPGLHPSGQGRQWYGLYPHDWNEAEVEVNKLLVTLKKFDTDRIPLKKTILLGFSQGAAMAIDAGFKLNFGLIVACSGYPHPNWFPGEKCSPLIVSHGLFDDVVPIDASRIIYEKVKNKSSELCELLEFDGFHQIDSNLIDFISSNISNIF
ncbi:esterase [Prochlorococcus marinus XMU1419]|uniref:alpha/beta hydrolase n=1 Tax=Prochlorococcus marinus TaxID=1219 RepID=UPI001AD95691|nr:alpha/beta fold hydrolase [Prochlorococcus marinus]MBO8233169.1 esterase [Prochlorococcus marinus XMU1419]MBW3076655.1 esterase [Prochlorococcus marinus str. XMU1419]